MSETVSSFEDFKEHPKLYKSKAITSATFLGGPLAAAYLVSENFKALGKHEEARNTIYIGVMATIILFAGIFMIPDRYTSAIPRQIIPLLYTLLIWGVIEWKQGDALAVHEKNGQPFYSIWRALGIGVLALGITCVSVFGYSFISSTSVPAKYEEAMTQFLTNESETLGFYKHLDTNSRVTLLKELDELVIPRWKENATLLQRMSRMENLPENLLEQNALLQDYTLLRIKAFKLIRKAIDENSAVYQQDILELHKEIDKKLQKLNTLL